MGCCCVSVPHGSAHRLDWTTDALALVREQPIQQQAEKTNSRENGIGISAAQTTTVNICRLPVLKNNCGKLVYRVIVCAGWSDVSGNRRHGTDVTGAPSVYGSGMSEGQHAVR